MISEIIIYAVIQVIAFFGSVLPNNGTPLKLPWGIDDIIVQGVTGYKILSNSFPPFKTLLTVFVIYLSFRIIMRLLRMIPFIGNSLE